MSFLSAFETFANQVRHRSHGHGRGEFRLSGPHFRGSGHDENGTDERRVSGEFAQEASGGDTRQVHVD